MLHLLFAAAIAQQQPEFDVILYGATGCVGHLAALHLANQTKLSWAISDINQTKLDALSAELLATKGPSSKPASILATLDGKTNMTEFVKRTRAIATAAGPFSIHNGAVLVRACAEHGVHYADVSDEFYWQREMIDGHDAVAAKSGAHIVLSGGFCALVGDLGSQLAIAELEGGLHARPNAAVDADTAAIPSTGTTAGADDAVAEISVDAWLEVYNGGLSAGVINTPTNASYPTAWDTDPYVLAPNASSNLKVDTTVAGIKYPAHIQGEGEVIANIFGPYDARLLRRTFTKKGQTVKLRVGALPSLYEKWTAFLASHPTSWKTLAKCPAPVLLQDGKWAYRFIASSSNASSSSSRSSGSSGVGGGGNSGGGTSAGNGAGTSAELLLSGAGDPGYHFTSIGLAETALCLAGWTPGCEQNKDVVGGAGGVTPPMGTIDPHVLLARLQSIGVVKLS